MSYPDIPKTVISAAAELTRPANQTPYAVKDAVANSATGASVTMLEFADCARPEIGGGGMISKVRLLTNNKDDKSTYRLHLYSTAPAAASRVGDNSPYTMLYANRCCRVGFIDIGPLNTEDPTGSDAANGLVSNDGVGMPLSFQCAAGDTKLYGLLEILSILTPASEQKYFVELTITRD